MAHFDWDAHENAIEDLAVIDCTGLSDEAIAEIFEEPYG